MAAAAAAEAGVGAEIGTSVLAVTTTGRHEIGSCRETPETAIAIVTEDETVTGRETVTGTETGPVTGTGIVTEAAAVIEAATTTETDTETHDVVEAGTDPMVTVSGSQQELRHLPRLLMALLTALHLLPATKAKVAQGMASASKTEQRATGACAKFKLF